MSADDARGWVARLRNRLVPGALLRHVRRHVLRVEARVESVERDLVDVKLALGRIEARQLAAADSADLARNEFRVFSQWNEDGILQLLVRLVPVPSRTFVEFGVESYHQANTRFLLTASGWSGVVIEADEDHVARIRSSRDAWHHDLVVVRAFVTRENIDALLRDAGAPAALGLLSIDVDGVDYWIWEALEAVSPAIVVVEYNHRFGPDLDATVPYDPAFDRTRAHHSRIYFGASLAALQRLGARKGYDLVGCESHGVNAFFVRRDLRPDALPARTAREAYVAGVGCEAHDEHGRRVRTTPDEERALLLSLPLVRFDGDGREVR